VRDAAKIALFGLLCLIWGSTWLVIKVGYGGLGPFNVAAIRFAIAAVVLSAIVPAVGARWPRGRSEWTLIFWVGLLLYAGDYSLIYWAEQYIDSGLTAVLFATFPLLTMTAAHLYVPGERLTTRKLAGGLLAFAGVGALFSDRVHVDASTLVPMAAVIVASTCAAAANVATKRHGAAIHTATLNACTTAIGAVLLLAMSIVSREHLGVPHDVMSWAAVGYLSLVGSVVAFLIYFSLLKTWDSTTVSFFAVFTPVIAIILGAAVLGEHLTVWSLAGAGLILSGVSMTLLPGRR
jgi:drug/metabolite transporter (DMT)-like permease